MLANTCHGFHLPRLRCLLEKTADRPHARLHNLTKEERLELDCLWEMLNLGQCLCPVTDITALGPPELSELIERLPNLPTFPSVRILNVEEAEQGKIGPLSLECVTPLPTIAERAFLSLARHWENVTGETPRERPLPRANDVRALACLLLAVEWGKDFTAVARDQICTNYRVSLSRGSRAWMDRLTWSLCEMPYVEAPQDALAVRELTSNLDHGTSGVRIWMMEIGWFARGWLERREAARKLLNNVAVAIGGADMAAGLAAQLFGDLTWFLEFARSYTPPDFVDQYHRRLKDIENAGIQSSQAPFWQLEAECRKLIEHAGLQITMAAGCGTQPGKVATTALPAAPVALAAAHTVPATKPATVATDAHTALVADLAKKVDSLAVQVSALQAERDSISQRVISETAASQAVPKPEPDGQYTAEEYRTLTTVPWNNLPKWLRAKAKRCGDDPWSKQGNPNRPYPYLQPPNSSPVCSSSPAQSAQSATQKPLLTMDDARALVLTTMHMQGQLNDETLPEDRFAIFKAKPFRDWPKEMQDALAPFGANLIN